MAGKVVDVTLRLIDQLSSPLNAIGGKLSQSANQWTKAGKQIQNAGKSISAVGSSLTKSLTVPIATAGTACVKLASDFEAGMSSVKSICGTVADEELPALAQKAKEMGLSFEEGSDTTSTAMNILSEQAKKMGAQTKFSVREATEAYQYMAMAGWKAGDMMDGISGIMYLAGATGEDLATTSDIVTDALTAFGMTAKDTESFVDILAKTSSSANTNVSLLGESFKYVAPVAGALGYSAQDTAVALGVMANSGIKASTAGTSLRSWLSRMSAPTKQVQTAMDKLGLSLTDESGNMKDFATIMRETRTAFAGLSEAEKASTASALAGKTGMSGLLAIVNSSDKDFNELSEAIYNSSGACKEMYDVANDNLQGQLTILKSTAESLAISFGERLTPYVSKLVGWLQSLAEKFSGLSNKQKDMIVKVALVVASIGPALLLFGKMVTTVGKVVSVVGKVGKAFKVAGSLMGLITSPVGITILAIGALIAIVVLLIKNWDKVKATAQKVFGYVKSVFESVSGSGESLKERLAPIGDKFTEIGSKLQELWTVVQPVVLKIGEIFKTVFSVYLGAVIGGAIGYFSSMFESVKKVIGGIMDIFSGLITFITGVFTGNWSKAWDGVKQIFSGAFSALVSLAKMPLNGVIGIINGAIAGINKLGIKVPDWVPVIGGKAFSINIPSIPMLAKGTDNWKGGIVQISEKGGEIVDLPSGSRVYPHDETVRKAFADGARSGGAGNITIAKIADQIVVREDADIDKIAQALADKLEKVSQNLGGGELGYLY